MTAAGDEKSDPMRVTLTLADADRNCPVPAQHRLKRLLKTALRSFGFRVVAIAEELPAPPAKGEKTP